MYSGGGLTFFTFFTFFSVKCRGDQHPVEPEIVDFTDSGRRGAELSNPPPEYASEFKNIDKNF